MKRIAAVAAACALAVAAFGKEVVGKVTQPQPRTPRPLHGSPFGHGGYSCAIMRWSGVSEGYRYQIQLKREPNQPLSWMDL